MQKKPKSEKKVLISAKVHPHTLKWSKKFVKEGLCPSFSQYVEEALAFYNVRNNELNLL